MTAPTATAVRRLLLALVSAMAAVGATLIVTPAAHATSSDVIRGGCDYTYNAVVGDTWVGVQTEHSVTTTGAPSLTPIGATVTCWVEVFGVVAPGTTHSYGDVAGVTGVQAGAAPISFTAPALDTISNCVAVDFADGTTTDATCFPQGDTVEVPPQFVKDTINEILDGWCVVCPETLDQVACPVFVQLSGSYGPITIEPDGDIDVPDPVGIGTSRIYDCPPYSDQSTRHQLRERAGR